MNNLYLKLPNLSFQLPKWEENNFDYIIQAIQTIRKIANDATKTNRFEQDYNKLLSLVQNHQFRTEMLETAGEIRALLSIILQTKNNSSIRLSPDLLDKFKAIRSPMSRLSLITLVNCYFEYFYQLYDKNEDLNYLVDFIRQQLNHYNNVNYQNNIFTLWIKFIDIIFHPKAHLRIVEWSKENQVDFDLTLKKMGIDSFKNGHLLVLSQNIYFIEELKQIPIGKKHPIFTQLMKEKVLESFYSKGVLLGHKVLEILIDRSKEEGEMSEDWQNIVLQIADDPHLIDSNYQRWWQPLGEDRAEQMRNWLIGRNLSLFLRILEESARTQRNDEMMRMFPKRKAMMLQLFQQKKIVGSRLFFTQDAVQYTESHSKGQKLRGYAHISGTSSVIYLRLSNGYHLIEGTHNFALKYMEKLPERIGITDYKKRNFNDEDFRTKLKKFYIQEFKNEDGFNEKRHHRNWQFEFIHWLEKTGLNLDISQVLTREEYLSYLDKFGV